MFMRLPAAFESVDDLGNVDRLFGHVSGFAELGVYGHHIVAPIELQTMACVIEHADGLLALQVALTLPIASCICSLEPSLISTTVKPRLRNVSPMALASLPGLARAAVPA